MHLTLESSLSRYESYLLHLKTADRVKFSVLPTTSSSAGLTCVVWFDSVWFELLNRIAMCLLAYSKISEKARRLSQLISSSASKQSTTLSQRLLFGMHLLVVLQTYPGQWCNGMRTLRMAPSPESLFSKL